MTKRRARSARAPATTSAMSAVDSLLENDWFRFIRSDAELVAFERRIGASTRTPHIFLVHALVGAGDIAEPEAEQIWRTLVTHRKALSAKVGRQVALRAAAIDWLYLQEEARRPIRAIVVSQRTLAAAIREGRSDLITGFPRRLQFERTLSRRLQQKILGPAALVFLDLDGFKRANDVFGHARGDDTLRRLASSLRHFLRTEDLVGRMGGDEFALFLPRSTVAQARRVAVRLRAMFEAECALEQVSFSFGVADARRGDTVATLLGRADRAMYRQKRARKAKLA